MCEPVIAAVDRESGRAASFGNEALALIMRSPDEYSPLRPVSGGIVRDASLFEGFLRFMLRRAGLRLLHPGIVICLPPFCAGRDTRAVSMLVRNAVAGRVGFIEPARAAASGVENAGIVINIDSAAVTVAVSAPGGGSFSLPLGGDAFDLALIRHLRIEYGLTAGLEEAGRIRRAAGCVFPFETLRTVEIHGRCSNSGLPKVVSVSSEELCMALRPVCIELIEAVGLFAARLAAPHREFVKEKGITLTGGDIPHGLDSLFAEKTGLTAVIAAEPHFAAVRGALQKTAERFIIKDNV